MDVYAKLKELGLTLPKAPAKGGVYASAKRFGGNLVYVSGCGPAVGAPVVGKLGAEFTVEEGQIFARDSMLNVLAVLDHRLRGRNPGFLPAAPGRQRRQRTPGRPLRRGERRAVPLRRGYERPPGQYPGGD